MKSLIAKHIFFRNVYLKLEKTIKTLSVHTFLTILDYVPDSYASTVIHYNEILY